MISIQPPKLDLGTTLMKYEGISYKGREFEFDKFKMMSL